MDKRYCPKCKITRFGNFCRTCGTALVPLSPDPLCECGERLSEYDEYCRNCGKRITEEAEG